MLLVDVKPKGHKIKPQEMVLCDLNIPWPCHDYQNPTAEQLAKLKATVLFCASLRYTHIAINFILNQESIKSTSKSKQQQQQQKSLNPIDLRIFKDEPMLADVQIYTRLTLCIEDTTNSVNLSKFSQHFDLVSITPLSEKALLLAITQDIDLISFRFDEKLPCFLRHKSVNSAVDKGIKFEIVYQPLFNYSSSQARRQFFSNTLNVIRSSRNRGLIISSGATESLQVKPMFDVVNLMVVLGLNKNSCIKAVTELPLKVILNGRLRLKSYKQLIAVDSSKKRTAEGVLDRQRQKFSKTK